MKRTAVLLALVLIVPSPGAAGPEPPDGKRVVRRAGPGSASPAMQRIEGYIEALNAGDFEKMKAFYPEGVTDDFRTRRTEEEDRALYARLTGDMGRLEIQDVVRDSPDEARVTAKSDRMPIPVQFVFRLKDDRIDGLSIRIGGDPDEGSAPDAVLDLPAGAGDDALARALDGQLQQLAARGEFSGVVLLARHGEPVFHRAYGPANRATGAANRTQTLFDVGSITKLMTKIAVARLLQEGKLSLDDPILRHIPDYPDREIAGKVTVQHLLDHSSGLGDIFNDRWPSTPKDRLTTPRAFFPLFAGVPLQFEPGQGKSYSNAGFVVLGAIVEAVSGKPYADYLEQTVFRPAGMKRSGFPRTDGESTERAVGYTREGGDRDELRPNLGMLPPRGCPAGSSSHAAEDLLKLDRALRSGKLLSREWAAWVLTGTKSAATARLDDPLGVAGGGPGVNAGMESDGATTVIVLANLDPPIAGKLARQLFAAMD